MLNRNNAQRTAPAARGVSSLASRRSAPAEADHLRDYVRGIVKVAQDNLRRAAGPTSFEEEHRIIPLKDALVAVEAALHPEDR